MQKHYTIEQLREFTQHIGGFEIEESWWAAENCGDSGYHTLTAHVTISIGTYDLVLTQIFDGSTHEMVRTQAREWFERVKGAFHHTGATLLRFGGEWIGHTTILPAHMVLGDGWRLARPLDIEWSREDDLWVISEPNFHNHTARETKKDALAVFKEMLVFERNHLAARERLLGPSLLEEMRFLVDLIEPIPAKPVEQFVE